jgi:hypothetical protein
VNGNARDENTRRQISQRDKKSLGETGRRADIDATLTQPSGIEPEGRRLVHVGQQQIKDQYEELIRWSLGAFCLWDDVVLSIASVARRVLGKDAIDAEGELSRPL